MLLPFGAERMTPTENPDAELLNHLQTHTAAGAVLAHDYGQEAAHKMLAEIVEAVRAYHAQ